LPIGIEREKQNGNQKNFSIHEVFFNAF